MEQPVKEREYVALDEQINEAKKYPAYESIRKAFGVREELIKSGALKVDDNRTPER